MENNTIYRNISGEITLYKVGKEGFGYDPIFQPEGYQQTFAELSSELKIRSATGERQHNNSSAFENEHCYQI
jgi:inosine/xanthosine triphosphate pyrophosphatase family protein